MIIASPACCFAAAGCCCGRAIIVVGRSVAGDNGGEVAVARNRGSERPEPIYGREISARATYLGIACWQS